MIERVVLGIISQCFDTDGIYLSPDYLDIVEELDLDENEIANKKIFVRYFISEEPILSIDDAAQEWAEYSLGLVQSKRLYGSEWTGLYGWDQNFILGGHDLYEELESHIGKHLILGVRYETPY